MALTERRRELSTLRCLGLPAPALRRFLLGEATALGILGSLPGLLLGIGLAHWMADLFWASAGSTFDRIDPAPVDVRFAELAKGFLAGLVASWAASWIPARQAARRSPLEGLRREAGTRHSWRQRGVSLLAALGLTLLSFVMVREQGFGLPRAGYIVMLMQLAAIVLGAYPLVTLLLRGVRGGLLRFAGPGARLAADHFDRSAGSTRVTLVAVSLGFGLVFSTHVMVRTFEDLLQNWFATTVQEDLFVAPPNILTHSLQSTPLSRELGEQIEDVEGVLHVHFMRFNRVTYRGQRVLVLAVDGGAPVEAGVFEYREGSRKDRERMDRGEGGPRVRGICVSLRSSARLAGNPADAKGRAQL